MGPSVEARLAEVLAPQAAVALLASAVPAVVIGPDGRVRELNQAAGRVAPLLAAGQPVAEALQIDIEFLRQAAGNGPVTLFAETVAAGRIALLGQALPLDDGGVLLLLVDLAPMREAEERRLERTPYGVLRLDREAIVRFANPAARALWSGRSDLVGTAFAALFPGAVGAEIGTRTAEVLATTTSRSVTVPGVLDLGDGQQQISSEPQLLLVPYFAPGGDLAGVLVHVRERIMEAVRLELRDAAAGHRGGEARLADWPSRMNAMLAVIHKLIPFERAVLSLFSEDRQWARTTLVHPPVDPQHEEPWPRAWVPVPPAEFAMLTQGPFALELPTLMKANPSLAEDPIVARHLRDGMVSLAALPIPSGHPEAVLSLISKQPRFFDDKERPESDETWPQPPYQALVQLGLEPLLIEMLRRVVRQEEAAVTEMGQIINRTETVGDATRALLARPVAQYQWDHASVFMVESGAEGGRFRLFAQHPDTDPCSGPHPLALRPGFTQSLYLTSLSPDEPGFDRVLARESGMLGAAVRARAPLFVADTSRRDEHGDAPHFFKSPAKQHGSALTVPIALDGRIRWVLDSVSRHPNASIEEDARRLGPIIDKLATYVATRRVSLLNDMLLERIEQGVLVTDSNGNVLRANMRARQMLGLPPHGDVPEGCALHAHAADADSRAWLAGSQAVGQVRLGPAGGIGSDVFVRRYQGQTEIRDVVWLLDGADEHDWKYDRTYIEATVQEVARQVRGPLMLASTLANRLLPAACRRRPRPPSGGCGPQSARPTSPSSAWPRRSARGACPSAARSGSTSPPC